MYMNCPLCLSDDWKEEVAGADSRLYYLCENCLLIFADPKHFLSAREEKARYKAHRNSIKDEGYVNFLSRVIDPMITYLKSGMRGLDYGCGPGPTLSHLVKGHGIFCDDYDPYFKKNSLCPPYDFIFSTETFEHFQYPAKEIQKIRNLLKSGGMLGIMTECWTTLEEFGSWYYTKDPTHMSFYNKSTFNYICSRFGFALHEQADKRVYILEKAM